MSFSRTIEPSPSPSEASMAGGGKKKDPIREWLTRLAQYIPGEAMALDVALKSAAGKLSPADSVSVYLNIAVPIICIIILFLIYWKHTTELTAAFWLNFGVSTIAYCIFQYSTNPDLALYIGIRHDPRISGFIPIVFIAFMSFVRPPPKKAGRG